MPRNLELHILDHHHKNTEPFPIPKFGEHGILDGNLEHMNW